jgi:hypothetical protein
VKIIDLLTNQITLNDAIGFARDELVMLRNPDGSVFILSQFDDFDAEVAALRRNPEFKTFLTRLSQEEPSISLEDLRKELAL